MGKCDLSNCQPENKHNNFFKKQFSIINGCNDDLVVFFQSNHLEPVFKHTQTKIKTHKDKTGQFFNRRIEVCLPDIFRRFSQNNQKNFSFKLGKKITYKNKASKAAALFKNKI